MPGDQPRQLAWLDGLDIPLVADTDQGFFEFGPDQVRTRATPERSNSERLWGSPGLTPVALAGTRPASVFDGAGAVRLNDTERPLKRGDVIAVPAWTEFALQAASQLDLFTFSDAPVFEKLNLLRTEVTA